VLRKIADALTKLTKARHGKPRRDGVLYGFSPPKEEPRRCRVTEAARWALLVYGILMIVGGVLGYVLPKTPSKISLIAGCASGILAIAAWLIARGDPVPGFAMGLVIAGGVGFMMLGRLKQTGKFMPSGMIVALSAIVVVLAAAALATSG
jgi:uncharacterized membrane protein (UPF0136 family)